MGQHQLGNFLVLRVGNSVFIFIHGFEKKRRGGGGVGGSGILLFSIEC